MIKSNWLRPGILLAGVCSASVMAAQPVMAQSADDEGSGLAEIIVTAQKRSENLQDVPVAITALNAADVQAAGVTGTLDLQAAVPSLMMTTATGTFGLPRIRGLGSTGQGPGIENPVALYVDGVYIGSSTANLMALSDVEQVAVLKGPQGTLFGRNATGGLIQVTTRKPSFELTGKGQFGFGNYQSVEASSYVSGGISENVAVSLSGQYENRNKGFSKNIFNGHDVQDGSGFGMRGKVLVRLSEATEAVFSADYSGRDGSDPAFRNFGRNALGLLPPGRDRDINADVDPFLKTRQWGTSLTLTHDFDSVQLMSISAYRKATMRSFFDPDGTTLPRLKIDNNQTDKQFTQELQLLSSGDGPFKWVLGGFYMWGTAGNDPGRTTGLFTFGNNGYSDLFSDTTLKSLAGFAQASYALGDATNLTGGIRYTSDKRGFSAQQIGFNGNTGATIQQQALITDERTFNRATWRASIDHRFSPELMVYASYNRGFRSGTFIPQSGFPVVVLQPEVVDAYEIGIKSDLLDRRVRINLAAYQLDQSGVQVMQIVSGVQRVYNASGGRIKGVDGDVTIQVNQNFRIFGGFAYTDARFLSFSNAIISTPFPLPGGFVIPTGQSCLGTNGNPLTQVGGNCLLVGDASGRVQPNSPKWTMSLGASYTIPTSSGNFTLAGNYYYNDGYVGNPDGRVRQPSYNTLDGSLTWKNPGNNLFLRLWGKNLSNAFYRTQLGASNSGDNGTAAPPRTYGATIGFDF